MSTYQHALLPLTWSSWKWWVSFVCFIWHQCILDSVVLSHLALLCSHFSELLFSLQLMHLVMGNWWIKINNDPFRGHFKYPPLRFWARLDFQNGGVRNLGKSSPWRYVCWAGEIGIDTHLKSFMDNHASKGIQQREKHLFNKTYENYVRIVGSHGIQARDGTQAPAVLPCIRAVPVDSAPEGRSHLPNLLGGRAILNGI